MKTAILKEVLEDNLRIAGKADNIKKRRKKKNLAGISAASFLVIFVYVFFNHFDFLEQNFNNIRLGLLNTGVANAEPTGEPGFDAIEASRLTPSRYSAFISEIPMPLQKVFGLKVKRILIDPGHGGEDRGTAGKLGTKEKDITLDIARKLRDKLAIHPGYQILMTREKDITLPLNDRIEIAKSCGADIFISVHINYIPDKPINIIETYYFGSHSDQAALLLAEKENKGTEYTLNDFKEIIRNIENTLKTQESRSLAYFIQESLYRNIRRKNRDIKNFGIKTAPFIVLLGVDVPGVLTEVTCISNIDEEKKLNREHYRKEIARYLAEGIVTYLNKK